MKKYTENQFVSIEYLFLPEIINRDVKKSKNPLQPIFEALTNSFEAIKDKQKEDTNYSSEILIELYSLQSTEQDTLIFSSLVIIDNGIGFNSKQFERFNTFRDSTKNYNNLGSGRFQYLHYFNNTLINSVFFENEKFYEREFSISKNNTFLSNKAIVKHNFCKDSDKSETKTKLVFSDLLENSSFYDKLNAEILRDKIFDRYLPIFCSNKDSLPSITIKHFINSELNNCLSITKDDIPNPDSTFDLEVQYCIYKQNLIHKINKTEKFSVVSFKLKRNASTLNTVNLVSKGEIVDDEFIKLEFLESKEDIFGKRYMFLVSGKFIDENDTLTRGNFNFSSRSKVQSDIFEKEEVIFLEDLNEVFNSKVCEVYPEFKEAKEKQNERVRQLQKMFLLDEESIQGLKFSVNDNDTAILNKIYINEARKKANSDASIKKKFESLKALDTSADDYQEKLEKYANEIVNELPIHNKNALSKYIARRKIVLRMFEYILNNELDIQNDKKRNKNESLLHNLIFQQRSNSPEDSDLWLLNEEFIYFKGTSDVRIENLEIDGIKIFKEEFSLVEKKHIEAFGENRMLNRPDILLFPEEGKCIIIELKSADVNASHHLTQIDKYASLIRNYTSEKFQITTFYGYLIAENIDDRDVRGAVSSFEFSYHFDFLFRPSIKVTGFDGRNDGTIYTEVIKYSTLLKRAKLRNKIFIKKLGFEYDSELDTL